MAVLKARIKPESEVIKVHRTGGNLDCINKLRLSDLQVAFVLYPAHRSISPPGIYLNQALMVNSAIIVEQANFSKY